MRRESTPLSVMMLDVDYFKRVNDTHGHAGGDEALRQVAQVMRQCLRRSDHVARWGGEEFLVVLPGAAQEEALILAERLRTAVASNTFRLKETATDAQSHRQHRTFERKRGRRESRRCHRTRRSSSVSRQHEGRNRTAVAGSTPSVHAADRALPMMNEALEPA